MRVLPGSFCKSAATWFILLHVGICAAAVGSCEEPLDESQGSQARQLSGSGDTPVVCGMSSTWTTLNWAVRCSSPENVNNFWDGLTTSGDTVIQINLGSRSPPLSGPVPGQLTELQALSVLDLSENRLTGPMPPVTMLLSTLDLSENELSGTLDFLTALTALRHLDISNNKFSGDIPSLSGMGNLFHFDISNNPLLTPSSVPDPVYNTLSFLSLADLRLSGPLPSSFTQLTALSTLVVRNCGFTGSINLISTLYQLKSIDFSHNAFEGTFPHTSILLAMSSVNLAFNEFTGPLPDMTNLLSLTTLNVSQNHFSATLPQVASSLAVLDVSGNDLHGQLKVLSHLSRLRAAHNQFVQMVAGTAAPTLVELDVGGNLLSGSIPILVAPNLERLVLSNNKLAGSFHTALSGVGKLTYLDLSSNDFSTFPSLWPWTWGDLLLLDLSNNEATGPLPVQGFTAYTRLEALNLADNKLSGAIPSTWSALTALTFLNLGGNELGGQIPTALTALSNLNYLNVSSNALASSFPPDWSKLTLLKTLDVRNNGLVIHGSDLAGLVEVTYIDISGNNLNQLPNAWSNLANLQVVKMSEMGAAGVFPSAWTALSQLSVLECQGNALSGSLSLLHQLPLLDTINAGSNSFNGVLPELGVGAKTVNLSYNTIEGSLPQQWSDLVELVTLDLQHNILSGELGLLDNAPSLQHVNVRANRFGGPLNLTLPNLRSFDAGNNLFTGSLPIGLSVSTDLKLLHLPNNSFTGSFPSQWSSLVSMEELHVHMNQLSAEIPASWSALTSLSQLKLDCNGGCHNLTLLMLTGLRDLEIRFHDAETLYFEPGNWVTNELRELTLSGQLQELSLDMLLGLTKLSKINFMLDSLDSLTTSEECTNVLHSNASMVPLPGAQLTLRRLGLKTIQDDAFCIFRSLTKLDLSHNDITTLSMDAFAGLTALGSLQLEGNPLSSIQSSSWCEQLTEGHDISRAALGHLSMLVLNNMQISSIAPSAFCIADKLFFLRLQNNQLSTFQMDSFLGLRFLLSLSLDGNPLTTVATSPVCNHYLSTGVRQSIEYAGFGALHLGNLPVQHVAEHAFCAVPSLMHVNLQNTGIQDFSLDAVAGLSALNSLDLHGTPLRRIQSSQWCNDFLSHGTSNATLSALLTLDLSGLDIEAWELESLCIAPNLQHLNLANNSLTSLSIDTLSGLEFLSTLVLEGNPIHAVNSSGLCRSYAQNGVTQHVPASLKELNLTAGVTSLHAEALCALPGLTSLDLSNNFLTGFNFDSLHGLASLERFTARQATALRILHKSAVCEAVIEGQTVPPSSLLASLMDVSFEGSGLESVAPLSLCIAPQLAGLNLVGNKIEEFTFDALAGLSALSALLIANNPIAAIRRSDYCAQFLQGNPPPGLFRSAAINSLEFPNQGLRLVEDEAFCLLQGLQRLDLSDNFLQYFSVDAIAGLTALSQLLVQGNDFLAVNSSKWCEAILWSQSQNHIAALSSLTNLNLNNFNIAIVENSSFCAAPYVLDLDLSGNQLTDFNFDAFAGLKVLSRLLLDGNPIGFIRRSHWCSVRLEYALPAFITLEALEHLSLNALTLSAFEDEAFCMASNLLSLTMQSSVFPSFSFDAFAGLSRLTSLDLTGSVIPIVNGSKHCRQWMEAPDTVNASVFLEAMTSFTLFAPRTTTVEPYSFCLARQLESLMLLETDMEEFSFEALAGLSSLSQLRIAANPIKHLVSEYHLSSFSEQRFYDMKALNLSGMFLSTLEPTIFAHFPAVTQLNLKNNRLHTFDTKMLAYMPNLQSLMLAGNVIEALIGVEHFSKCRDSEGNRISTRITNLDLSRQQLRNISGTICFLDRMETIDLSNNSLSELTGTWDVPQLSTVKLASNTLRTHVPPPLPFVVSLDLSWNSLDSLEMDSQPLLGSFPRLANLLLTGNPVANLTDSAFSLNAVRSLLFLQAPLDHVSPGARAAMDAMAVVAIDGTPLADAAPCVAELPGYCMGVFSGSLNVFCSKLEPGEYCPSIKSLLWCEPGYYCLDGARTPCPASTFSLAGQSECITCPQGRYSDKPASVQCEQCQGGFICNGGRREACPAGTYSDSGASECETCSPGRYSAANASTSCSQCEAGYHCTNGHRKECPANSYSGLGATTCEACGTGMYTSGPAAPVCSVCPAGHVCSTGTPVPCQPGTYAELSTCVQCKPGRYSGLAATTCVECDYGSVYININSTGAGECERCPNGTYYQAPATIGGTAHCLPCRPGHYCLGGAQPETACAVGRYAASFSQAKCTACPPGTSGAASNSRLSQATACTRCPQGRFSSTAGATTCTLCPSGRFGVELENDTLPWSEADACAVCGPGSLCLPGALQDTGPDLATFHQLQLLDSAVPLMSHAIARENEIGQLGVQNTVLESISTSSTGAVADSEVLPFPVSVLIYIIGGAACALVAITLVLVRRTLKERLARVDIFNLDHPLEPNEVMKSKPTYCGGVFTLCAIVVIVALLVNTLYSYFSEENIASTASVKPVTELDIIGTREFGLDVWFQFSVLAAAKGMGSVCDSINPTTTIGSTLHLPPCVELATTAEEDDVHCVCRGRSSIASSSLFVFPQLSVIAFTTPAEVSLMAWRAYSLSGSGKYSVLEATFAAAKPSGVPSGIAVDIRILPDFIHDRVSKSNSSGYTLFPQQAQYTPPHRVALGFNDTYDLKFAFSMGDLGRETVREHKTTPLQALSGALGLIVGVMGGFRIAFKYSRKTHKKVKARKQLNTQQPQITPTDNNRVPTLKTTMRRPSTFKPQFHAGEVVYSKSQSPGNSHIQPFVATNPMYGLKKDSKSSFI